MARELKCDWVGAVNVSEYPLGAVNDCHNNVLAYIDLLGGEQQLGYYFVKGFNTMQAIKHSVWKDGNDLLDVTPYNDNREYIIFAKQRQTTEKYSVPNCYIQSLDKYIKQENCTMYYVYQLVDPRNNQPFYVGKGSGARAQTHLWQKGFTPNPYKENKISAIRNEGLEPCIEIIAENIIDEQLAYDMEAAMIARYGRKGYDKDGILTNKCPDNRPPNHKGKTYDEIYGAERAAQQRRMRSKLQKDRGGYGPKKHSAETRLKFKELNTGTGNPMYGRSHSHKSKQLIGEANKRFVGELNKKSKKYKLTSPIGEEIILFGGDAAKYCKEHDLSFSTLRMQIYAGWGIPKKGKTKGWKFEVISDK